MRAAVCVVAALAAGFGLADGNAYVSYRSFLKQPEMTSVFAEMGVTTRCFFAANTVNGGGNPYCEYPMIWRGTNSFDFTAFDAQVEDLLKASPTADFLCIVDLNTPDWAVRKCGGDSFHDVTHITLRQGWRRMTTHWLTNFLSHAERRVGKRVRGYLLSGGGTSEWYEINHGKRSRWKDEAWRKWCAANDVDHGSSCPGDAELSTAAFENTIYDPATEREKIDYWRFHSTISPEAILMLARAARAVLPKEREIGVFFGYALESHDLGASFAHLGYERVFASPDIDFVVSPGNYSDRDIGGGSGSQLPHGTARRYGKRLLHEIDFAPHGCARWKTPWQTLEDDIAGNLREASFAIASHCSFWWFDMWGGFYDDPRLRTAIACVSRIGRERADNASPSVADVLLVCDPQSMCYVNERTPESPSPSHAKTPNAILRVRNALARSGAVHDVVSFNDLEAIDLSPYKVICFPLAIEISPAREEILREKVCTPGRTVVWCHAPGLSDGRTLDTARVRRWAGVGYGTAGISTTPMSGGWTAVYAADWRALTPEALKTVTRAAGCWTCLDECAPVFANRNFLAVHVKNGGHKTLHLRERAARVTDLMTGEIVGTDTAEITIEFKTPDTRLFDLSFR